MLFRSAVQLVSDKADKAKTVDIYEDFSCHYCAEAVQGEEGQQHEQRDGGVQQGMGPQDVLGLGLPHGVAKPGPFL